MAGVSYQGGPGRFDYTDDRGTYLDDRDDGGADRENNAFADYDVMLKWDRKASAFRIYTGAYYQQRFHDEPGEGFLEVDDAESKSELVLGYVGVKRPGIFTPELDAEVRVHALQERVWFKDDDGELGPPQDGMDLRTRLGADLYLYYYGLRDNRIAAYLGLYEEAYRPESELDPGVEDISASRSGLYFNATDEVSLIEGRLKIKPQVRYFYEGNRYEGQTLIEIAGQADETTSFFSTSLALSASYMINGDLYLHLHAGQRYRTPGFFEEFGDRAALLGNPDLTAERNFSQEASLIYDPGASLGFDEFSVKAGFYQSQLDHRIGWVDLGGGILHAENVGDVKVTGVEFALCLKVRDALSLDASYAFQDSFNESDNELFDDNELPGVPRNTAHMAVTLHQSYGRLFYKGYYQDVRYLDEANLVRADPRFIHNLGIAYQRGGFNLGFEAKNPGNDQSRELLDYPLPGARYVVFMEVEG
jgi:hypothetical protein